MFLLDYYCSYLSKGADTLNTQHITIQIHLHVHTIMFSQNLLHHRVKSFKYWFSIRLETFWKVMISYSTLYDSLFLYQLYKSQYNNG